MQQLFRALVLIEAAAISNYQVSKQKIVAHEFEKHLICAIWGRWVSSDS